MKTGKTLAGILNTLVRILQLSSNDVVKAARGVGMFLVSEGPGCYRECSEDVTLNTLTIYMPHYTRGRVHRHTHTHTSYPHLNVPLPSELSV